MTRNHKHVQLCTVTMKVSIAGGTQSSSAYQIWVEIRSLKMFEFVLFVFIFIHVVTSSNTGLVQIYVSIIQFKYK